MSSNFSYLFFIVAILLFFNVTLFWNIVVEHIFSPLTIVTLFIDARCIVKVVNFIRFYFWR